MFSGLFNALFFVGLVVIAAVGGKSCLLLLAGQPVIGPVAAWYVGYVGPVGDGMTSNLIYGAMALQLVFMALAPVLYGPTIVRKAMAWFRARRVAAHG